MPAKPEVCRLGPDDAAAIADVLRLFAEAFDDAESYLGPPPSKAYLERLLGDDGFILLTARVDETLVGALAAYELRKFEQERSEIYIYDLAVAEPNRRRGVATALIEALRPIARAKGAWVIYVQADLGDEPAIALYRKLGVQEDVHHFDIDRGERMGKSGTFTRRELLAAGAAAALAPLPALAQPRGRIAPDWQALIDAYRVPDWFRDAKFGIWSHWGPQCVPEYGDWYGRKMYVQGDPFYDHHVRTYGHPSRSGFIEFIGRWRAENWEPEALTALFRRAGARYVMAMANHHDNFDNFDSAHHAWNSVRVGPRRDIVGTWAANVRAAGLRFGVSNHSAHAWHWWQSAYGYDPEGPMRGVRYDAFRLRRRDGAGTWWEGLDPQELYSGPNMVPPDGIDSIAAMNAWHAANDRQWMEHVPPRNPGFADNWLRRQNDLIEKYRPDIVYLDDYRLPFGRIGLEAVAHYYNRSLDWHGGMDVVLTAKQLTAFQRHGIVEDVERGFLAETRARPWQTSTCLGDWHYDRKIFERHGYKSARNVVQRLCDVVSKNGNLLLSVPQRGDGAIDADEVAILEALAGWFAVNGEAIYGTRPWRMFGEGPTRLEAGSMNEARASPFTSADIRFTAKGGALHALFLEWPETCATIAALGTRAMPEARIEQVELFGGAPLEFARDEEGLKLTLPPPQGGAFVPAVRILGRGLV